MGTVVAATLVAVAWPAAAAAQGPSSTDPAAGSPSGTIYEIPLDTARRDAAPRSGPRGGADVRSRTSPLRSENNFGSSSEVPGAPGSGSSQASGQPSSAGAVGGGSAAGAGGRRGSAGGGSAGGGSGGGGSGGGADQGSAGGGGAGGAGQGSRTRHGANSEALIHPSLQTAGPSSTRTYLLIAIGIAVALGLGAAARLATRRQ
jgi:hypothetical protein